jgi:multidrug efflux pump subunit AcrA (membrane-fusion protein)
MTLPLHTVTRCRVRRNAFARVVAVITAIWLGFGIVGTRAHEGDDHQHAPPNPAAVNSLPRIVTQSEAYELVGILEGERLTIYLDRFDDNAPVTDATIMVAIQDESIAASPSADNTYTVTSKRFDGSGPVELVFDIKVPSGDDLLIGMLTLPQHAGAAAPNSTSLLRGALSTLRHAVEDHLGLVGLAVLLGAVLGLMFRRSRQLRGAAVLVLAICALNGAARAHEGHDHNNDTKTFTAAGNTARRLPDGQLFVPKPMQRILDVRTVVAKAESVAKAVVLIGRIIPNPNRSGLLQSITGGRVIAPEQGLPPLGQTVAKGDVLALIEPPVPAADRTTILERSGEIEQLIAVAEARLKRLRPLAERGVAPMTQVTDAETELEGLKRRREIMREMRVAPDVLRAPLDGVIAASRVVAGQVVQAQDVLFQIVDPQSLWVEAFDYGAIDAATLKQAAAVGASGKPLKLALQGFSRALQQQATVVHFAIIDPPPTIRVSEPVTVTVKKGEEIAGVIVSRDAVVRGGNGETIVWRHVEPERFDPRPVRIEPFDAANVVIVAGIASGERIVTRGAELINQIR